MKKLLSFLTGLSVFAISSVFAFSSVVFSQQKAQSVGGEVAIEQILSEIAEVERIHAGEYDSTRAGWHSTGGDGGLVPPQ